MAVIIEDMDMPCSCRECLLSIKINSRYICVFLEEFMEDPYLLPNCCPLKETKE